MRRAARPVEHDFQAGGEYPGDSRWRLEHSFEGIQVYLTSAGFNVKRMFSVAVCSYNMILYVALIRFDVAPIGCTFDIYNVALGYLEYWDVVMNINANNCEFCFRILALSSHSVVCAWTSVT